MVYTNLRSLLCLSVAHTTSTVPFSITNLFALSAWALIFDCVVLEIMQQFGQWLVFWLCAHILFAHVTIAARTVHTHYPIQAYASSEDTGYEASNIVGIKSLGSDCSISNSWTSSSETLPTLTFEFPEAFKPTKFTIYLSNRPEGLQSIVVGGIEYSTIPSTACPQAYVFNVPANVQVSMVKPVSSVTLRFNFGGMTAGNTTGVRGIVVEGFSEWECVGGYSDTSGACYEARLFAAFTQATAETHCSTEGGGTLASVHLQEEWDALAFLFSSSYYSGHPSAYWVGLEQADGSTWVWSDGTEVANPIFPTKWKTGHPVAGEQCAVVTMDNGEVVLESRNCTSTAYMLCKRIFKCNDNGDCISVYTDPANITDARANCAAKNGATRTFRPTTVSDLELLANLSVGFDALIFAQYDVGNTAWLFQDDLTGNASTAEIIPQQWATGEPTLENSDSCAIVYGRGHTGVGKLASAYCGIQYGYACKTFVSRCATASGRCYYLFTEATTTWSGAGEYCTGRGLQLAPLFSDETGELSTADYQWRENNTVHPVWLGIEDLDNDGSWRFLQGYQFSNGQLPWAFEEPSPLAGYNCGTMCSPGQLCAANCSIQAWILCADIVTTVLEYAGIEPQMEYSAESSPKELSFAGLNMDAQPSYNLSAEVNGIALRVFSGWVATNIYLLELNTTWPIASAESVRWVLRSNEKLIAGVNNLSAAVYNTDTDVNNCGSIGNACVDNHVSVSCVSGKCSYGSCESGWQDCNSQKSLDGCERSSSLGCPLLVHQWAVAVASNMSNSQFPITNLQGRPAYTCNSNVSWALEEFYFFDFTAWFAEPVFPESLTLFYTGEGQFTLITVELFSDNSSITINVSQSDVTVTHYTCRGSMVLMFPEQVYPLVTKIAVYLNAPNPNGPTRPELDAVELAGYPQFTCRGLYSLRSGACYEPFSVTADWNTAQEQCAAIGGTLAVIHSEQELQLLVDSITMIRPYTAYWTDLTSYLVFYIPVVKHVHSSVINFTIFQFSEEFPYAQFQTSTYGVLQYGDAYYPDQWVMAFHNGTELYNILCRRSFMCSDGECYSVVHSDCPTNSYTSHDAYFRSEADITTLADIVGLEAKTGYNYVENASFPEYSGWYDSRGQPPPTWLIPDRWATGYPASPYGSTSVYIMGVYDVMPGYVKNAQNGTSQAPSACSTTEWRCSQDGLWCFYYYGVTSVTWTSAVEFCSSRGMYVAPVLEVYWEAMSAVPATSILGDPVFWTGMLHSPAEPEPLFYYYPSSPKVYLKLDSLWDPDVDFSALNTSDCVGMAVTPSGAVLQLRNCSTPASIVCAMPSERVVTMTYTEQSTYFALNFTTLHFSTNTAHRCRLYTVSGFEVMTASSYSQTPWSFSCALTWPFGSYTIYVEVQRFVGGSVWVSVESTFLIEFIDFGSDPLHCGGLNRRCSTHHTTPLCAYGQCAGECDEGWKDCNNNILTDGCETPESLSCPEEFSQFATHTDGGVDAESLLGQPDAACDSTNTFVLNQTQSPYELAVYFPEPVLPVRVRVYLNSYISQGTLSVALSKNSFGSFLEDVTSAGFISFVAPCSWIFEIPIYGDNATYPYGNLSIVTDSLKLTLFAGGNSSDAFVQIDAVELIGYSRFWCRGLYDNVTGACYELVTAPEGLVLGTSASAWCRNFDMGIAVLHRASEFTTVKGFFEGNIFNPALVPDPILWIGLNYTGNGNEWQWSDGYVLNSTDLPFAMGYPQAALLAAIRRGDNASSSYGDEVKVVDLPETDVAYVLCERRFKCVSGARDVCFEYFGDVGQAQDLDNACKSRYQSFLASPNSTAEVEAMSLMSPFDIWIPAGRVSQDLWVYQSNIRQTYQVDASVLPGLFDPDYVLSDRDCIKLVARPTLESPLYFTGTSCDNIIHYICASTVRICNDIRCLRWYRTDGGRTTWEFAKDYCEYVAGDQALFAVTTDSMPALRGFEMTQYEFASSVAWTGNGLNNGEWLHYTGAIMNTQQYWAAEEPTFYGECVSVNLYGEIKADNCGARRSIVCSDRTPQVLGLAPDESYVIVNPPTAVAVSTLYLQVGEYYQCTLGNGPVNYTTSAAVEATSASNFSCPVMSQANATDAGLLGLLHVLPPYGTELVPPLLQREFIDILNDVDNCGGPGQQCSYNGTAQRECTDGQCTGPCMPLFADCDGDRLSNGCEQFQSIESLEPPYYTTSPSLQPPLAAGSEPIATGAYTAVFLPYNASNYTGVQMLSISDQFDRAFTIEFWVYVMNYTEETNHLRSGHAMPLVSFYDPDNIASAERALLELRIFYDDSKGHRVEFLMGGTSSNDSDIGLVLANCNNTLLLFNTWYHIAVSVGDSPTPSAQMLVHDVSGNEVLSLTGRFYGNGGLQRWTAQTMPSTAVPRFRQGLFGWYGFNLAVDELRVWSVFRSATDIRDHMFRTIPYNEQPQLKLYWTFDTLSQDIAGQSYGSLPDNSIYGNDLIPDVGFPVDIVTIPSGVPLQWEITVPANVRQPVQLFLPGAIPTAIDRSQLQWRIATQPASGTLYDNDIALSTVAGNNITAEQLPYLLTQNQTTYNYISVWFLPSRNFVGRLEFNYTLMAVEPLTTPSTGTVVLHVISYDVARLDRTVDLFRGNSISRGDDFRIPFMQVTWDTTTMSGWVYVMTSNVLLSMVASDVDSPCDVPLFMAQSSSGAQQDPSFSISIRPGDLVFTYSHQDPPSSKITSSLVFFRWGPTVSATGLIGYSQFLFVQPDDITEDFVCDPLVSHVSPMTASAGTTTTITIQGHYLSGKATSMAVYICDTPCTNIRTVRHHDQFVADLQIPETWEGRVCNVAVYTSRRRAVLVGEAADYQLNITAPAAAPPGTEQSESPLPSAPVSVSAIYQMLTHEFEAINQFLESEFKASASAVYQDLVFPDNNYHLAQFELLSLTADLRGTIADSHEPTFDRILAQHLVSGSFNLSKVEFYQDGTATIQPEISIEPL